MCDGSGVDHRRRQKSQANFFETNDAMRTSRVKCARWRLIRSLLQALPTTLPLERM